MDRCDDREECSKSDSGNHTEPTAKLPPRRPGTHDQVTRITSLDTARQLLRAKQILVLDCGHMAPCERPADVAAHLVAFIDSHPERSNS
jgi:hypothetical protein